MVVDEEWLKIVVNNDQYNDYIISNSNYLELMLFDQLIDSRYRGALLLSVSWPPLCATSNGLSTERNNGNVHG